MTNTPGDKFSPSDLANQTFPNSGLPPEIWTIIQSAPATFPPQYFLDVSRNLLENPNLTASHLSRAEISYSSFTDATFNPKAQHAHHLAKIVKHLKPEHQPKLIDGGVEGYELDWTVVRKLIPRNPKLDKALLQTCHLFTSTADVEVDSGEEQMERVKAERYLLIYIPHAESPEDIPFYHPKVRGLAILYTYISNLSASVAPGSLSIFYDLFPSVPLDNRLSRTALRMLEIIHKHARGRMNGYTKRVHHDVIIPQKRFQDTYAWLKGKYAQDLIKSWVEQTPPEKHVFEDLGIAAFLMELWVDMYGGDEASQEHITFATSAESIGNAIKSLDLDEKDARMKKAQKKFPGFVDIGCGNGLLVWILNQEGWHGWGFDARQRKTWATFNAAAYGDKLKELLLVPEVLENHDSPAVGRDEGAGGPAKHNGVFPTGTFLLANHADELTIWTPLLAYLSSSPFIAIPCCSHNFDGSRFRAPNHPDPRFDCTPGSGHSPSDNKKNKQVSAYASFCSHIMYLTDSMGYVPEKEHLRIPSTRNVAIIGRRRMHEKEEVHDFGRRIDEARKVVEDNMGGTIIEDVKRAWIEQGTGLMKGKGGGH